MLFGCAALPRIDDCVQVCSGKRNGGEIAWLVRFGPVTMIRLRIDGSPVHLQLPLSRPLSVEAAWSRDVNFSFAVSAQAALH